MAETKKKGTVQMAEELVKPVLEELGLELWDTRFEKEGATWYLRYFIDKSGGVNISDCVEVSHSVEKLLDAADPIEQSYTLEVCSPGIERQLEKDWHFQTYLGQLISVRLIRPVEGMRDFVGKLTAKQGDQIHLLLDEDVEMVFSQKEAAYIRLYVDFETGGLEQ